MGRGLLSPDARDTTDSGAHRQLGLPGCGQDGGSRRKERQDQKCWVGRHSGRAVGRGVRVSQEDAKEEVVLVRMGSVGAVDRPLAVPALAGWLGTAEGHPPASLSS